MGNFYTQIIVPGVSREACVEVVRSLGRRCLIGPKLGNAIAVFDSASEQQDIDELDSVALTLSHELDSWAVGIMNHDDDRLLFRIFQSGEERRHIAASRLGTFDTSGLSGLREALAPRSSRLALYWAFLRPTLFQVGRHQSIARVLGISPWTVGAGYRYILEEDVEDHPGLDAFIRV